MDKERKKELGKFLKSKRGKISPTEFGLPIGKRRKAIGLRREELSQLAGIGLTWYTWLEQGRDIQVSTQVLDSISRILKLNHEERKHIYLLANHQIPLDNNSDIVDTLHPVVQNFINHQKDCPIYVTNEKWDVISWNKAACKVFGDFTKMSSKEKNALWRCFCSKDYKELLVNWEDHAKRLLAQFRATTNRFIGERWYKDLIDELRTTSEKFNNWWGDQEILGTPIGEKEIRHPYIGTLFMEHMTLQVYDSPDLKLTIYRPLEKGHTAEKMERLLNG
ncbi:helix-turn-helix domain-containing protein [Terrilactibacillus sp. BCM23-1]|uniref:Helix-turn-helix domain-containing protein n=2 Tax=Terrilactibacillus TaxID=1795633 RepID=A0A6N8CT16_9BACI|nr:MULTISPECIES: helix-turn-helix transcriptional regulator [Terrilactibacillus]MTT32085.1 helix-turn-helix domain-containing protein [Terrilactibacillus tamarindi]